MTTSFSKKAEMTIQRNAQGQIYSPVRAKWLFETPEERVRQEWLRACAPRPRNCANKPSARSKPRCWGIHWLLRLTDEMKVVCASRAESP